MQNMHKAQFSYNIVHCICVVIIDRLSIIAVQELADKEALQKVTKHPDIESLWYGVSAFDSGNNFLKM